MSFDAFSRRQWLVGATAISGALAETPASQLSPDPTKWTLKQASDALRRGNVSSEELTKSCLQKIRRRDSVLNAFITVTEESALEEAKESDRLRKTGRPIGPLSGIPIALKDNIDTAGVRTTAASQVFRDRVPSEDAEVTRRLKQAGAVFLGKLNLDEFAFEGTGTTSFFGPVHNPWKLDRITGGSSAGSAAAVAAGMCFASVGSDDGGSVRIPAAYCGVTGFKTSYGRVSTRGVIPSAYSLDTMGPITRSVEDAALLLQAIAGFDPEDTITLDRPAPDYTRALTLPTRQLRVGIPRDYFFENLHPDVSTAIERAIELVRAHVSEVRDVVLPRFQFVENGSYDVELYHYHKQFFDKSPELYHPWSRRQLNELKQVSAPAYVETLKRIREARRDIGRVFTQVDVLVLPTMHEPAPTIQATMDETHRRLPSNVSAFNRFGVPALSIPCGFSSEGLPIGMQVVGPAFKEERVLSVAFAYQQSVDWRRPTPDDRLR